MAIIKQARNYNIKVETRHTVIAREIEKTAQTIKLTATCGNIELYSIKKIRKNGNIN
ncbi:hypothetical protein [Flavobacterium panacagri]|uniref:hypothetical protein n=1 Tax=Flavobacterium panacagri TaxID=3034146 RepID=UPI0025A5082E|nr:hypothetical protein [Flavobacterium panacagri]